MPPASRISSPTAGRTEYQKLFRKLLLVALLALVSGCSSFDVNGLIANRRPRNFLRADSYTRLSVEVIAAEGLAPPLADLDFLEARIKQYCNKPDGVFVSRYPTTIPRSSLPADPVWTEEALGALRDKYATHRSSGDSLVMHILFVPGRDEDDDGQFRVGALTFAPDVFAVYSERRGNSSLGGIMVHEMGHIFGLVNNGTPQQSDHENGPEGGHCKNDRCAMFWIQVADPQPDYDDACKVDLKANGSK